MRCWIKAIRNVTDHCRIQIGDAGSESSWTPEKLRKNELQNFSRNMYGSSQNFLKASEITINIQELFSQVAHQDEILAPSPTTPKKNSVATLQLFTVFKNSHRRDFWRFDNTDLALWEKKNLVTLMWIRLSKFVTFLCKTSPYFQLQILKTKFNLLPLLRCRPHFPTPILFY